jgi:hypothetical protein
VFVSPDYEARVVFEVPGAIGDTLTVRATAVAPWGPNGEYGYAGTWRETTITVADVCPPPEGTYGNEDRPIVTSPPPPSVDAPPPTLAPTEGAPAPPPVQVMGASVTRVPAQTAAPATELAFTGDHTTTLASFGAVALVIGSAAVLATRRRDGEPDAVSP